MQVRATAKYVGTSSRKIGLVAALIRGLNVDKAGLVLAQANKRATDPVGKVLKSAVANAENNFNLRPADLHVAQVLVGPGPTLKRFRPRAKGSASSIRKRTSHITVVVSDERPVAKKAATQSATAIAAAHAAQAAEAKPAAKAQPKTAKKEAK